MISHMWLWFKLITFMRYCYRVNPEFDASAFLMYTCIYNKYENEAYEGRFDMATREFMNYVDFKAKIDTEPDCNGNAWITIWREFQNVNLHFDIKPEEVDILLAALREYKDAYLAFSEQ